GTLALTVVWLTGCRVPDTCNQRVSALGSTVAMSVGANSRVTVALPGASAAACLLARNATLAAIAPTTMAVISAPSIRRRVNQLAIQLLSPQAGIVCPLRLKQDDAKLAPLSPT